jgi:hypothetical protein
MKPTPRPVRTTILFGLSCGLFFIPLNLGFGQFFIWEKAYCMTLWVYLAAYGFLLVRWSRTNVFTIFFPLLFLLMAAYGVDSVSVFLALALVIFSWIRSGICYRQPFGRRLLAEVILSLGGGAFVAGLAPVSLFSRALGVWMFFLVQALYFFVCETIGPEEKKIELDPFEQAGLQAEQILSSGHYPKSNYSMR